MTDHVFNARAAGLPNAIFGSLHHGGAGAIVPILKDVLAAAGFFLTPFGPEATGVLPEVPAELRPYFHWTHHPFQAFANGLAGGPARYVYLHRDPRDVIVSFIKDKLFTGEIKPEEEASYFDMAGGPDIESHVRWACEWVGARAIAPVKVIAFDEVKRDPAAVALDAVAHLGVPLDALTAEGRIRDVVVRAAEAHSYERQSGRKRGEDGPILRNDFIVRKGVSGEWRDHFTPARKKTFKAKLGTHLIYLGYEANHDW